VTRRPDPPPLQANEVAAVATGTAVFAVLLVVAILERGRLAADGHEWWIATLAIGIGLGLLGLVWVVPRARAHKAAPPQDTPQDT
jgi:hypothetical protein